MPDRFETPVARLAAALFVATPLVNALADVTTNLATGALGPGMLRAIFISGILLVFVIVGSPLGRITVAVYALLCYQLILVLLGSNVFYAISNSYSKVALSTLMVIAGLRYLGTMKSFDSLILAIGGASAIIISHLAVSQILGLGESAYVDDTLYMGGAKVQVAYSLALFLVLAPWALRRFVGWRRAFVAIVAAGAMVAVLLILRRGALLGMAVGLLTYFLLSGQRARLIRRLAVPTLLALLALIATFDTFQERFTARSFENRPLREEARFFETLRVLDEGATGSVRHILFGSELYNSPAYFGVRRQLHVDYNILLHGSGAVGLALYLLVHAVMITSHMRWRKRIESITLRREFNGSFWALMAMSAVISLSGSIASLGYRSALFLTLGCVLAVERRGGVDVSQGLTGSIGGSRANAMLVQESGR